MPPNGDSSIRQRVMPKGEVQAEETSLIRKDSTSPGRIDTLNNLKESEIAIEGIIYDLTGFEHPGGNIIHIFGGSDVTVQYKMMHTHHTPRHLEKLNMVGRVTDWKQEYVFGTEFENEMKREVFRVVKPGYEFGTLGYFIRIGFYMILFAYLQYKWITEVSSFRLALALAVARDLIILNVQHDANHGAISRKPWVNDFLGFTMDLTASQKWYWILLHSVHHAYTNNHLKDNDVVIAEPFVLFHNYELTSPKRRRFHRFQSWYLVPTISFVWLSAFERHIFTLRFPSIIKAGFKMNKDFIQKRRKYAVALRIIYIYLDFLCPLRTAVHAGKIGRTLMHIVLSRCIGSFVISTIVLLSHNNELVSQDPLKSLHDSGEPICWFKAQVETSTSYGGFVAATLTGGMNFQIEHHLFPRMCSAHYPYIAPTVRSVCKKYGVRYGYYPWIWQNFISMLKRIHKVGCAEYWKNPLSDGSF